MDTLNLMKTWRLLDTGSLTAAENMALDEIILETLAEGYSPETLRFLQFNRVSALVGFHQSVDREIRSSFCLQNDIEINRRITGGGAIVFEPDHLGWEVFADRSSFPFSTDRQLFLRKMSQPMVDTLRSLGIPADYRIRNDIEVKGKKISGTGGTEEKNALMFQGSLLTDLDIPRMLRCLRIPVEKLKNKEIDSIRERVTTIARELPSHVSIQVLKNRFAEFFASRFDIRLVQEGLSDLERERLKDRLPFFRSDHWIERVRMPESRMPVIETVRKFAGGVIQVIATIDLRGRSIQSIFISGDFFSYPRQSVNRLESFLKGLPVDRDILSRELAVFFRSNPLPGVAPDDIFDLIDDLSRKLDLMNRGFDVTEVNQLFLPNGSMDAVIAKPPLRAVLLPYCAKLPDCDFRQSNGCSFCGSCSISEATETIEACGIPALTITSFEHLIRVLKDLSRSPGFYIGCCCRPFFVKHQDDFETAGIPGILIDIDNTTCYELDQMKAAYAGRFEGWTRVNTGLLKKVLHAAL